MQETGQKRWKKKSEKLREYRKGTVIEKERYSVLN